MTQSARVLELQRSAGNRATAAAIGAASPARTQVLQRRKWWQFWKPKAPAVAPVAPVAPVVAPPPVATAKVQYGTTGVYIFPNAAYPGVDYVADVTQHLNDIQAVVGAGFFTALGANGKQQGIKYGGPNSNQCSGAPHGYTKLRKFHEAGSAAQFGAELTSTLGNMGRDRGWLVTALQAQGLPHWNNVIDPAPIAEFPNAGVTGTKVDDWLAGTGLPNVDEMDVLMLVVQAGAAPGNGAHARIDYDPLKTSVASGPRPPQVALFHELCHAYYYARGEQLGREDSSAEAAGGRLFELMAVGLPPFDTRPYSENALRAAWAPPVPLRLNYP